ncbi:hypothetical protein OV320_0444 [Actinobacteria bacterium OV320]|nr:hypothetical protein OV320_0444 [Actinobacteria bacterium OV320]
MSLLPDAGPGEAFEQASRFREELFACLTARGDELFDLVDALLCADGPVTSPVDLTLVAEHRRGHGAMYEALNHGNVDVPRLRQVLAGLPMPRAADGRLLLAVDVSNWLRPDAPTSADRLFRHVYGRSGRPSDQFIPRLAVPVRRRPRIGPDVLVPAPGRRPPRTRGRRRRGHRLPAPPGGHRPDRDGPLARRRPRHPHRLRRRLRRPTHGPPPRRPPGRGAGTDALRPRHATTHALAQGVHPGLPPGRATAEARQGVPLRQAGDLGRAGRGNRAGHRPRVQPLPRQGRDHRRRRHRGRRRDGCGAAGRGLRRGRPGSPPSPAPTSTSPNATPRPTTPCSSSTAAWRSRGRTPRNR